MSASADEERARGAHCELARVRIEPDVREVHRVVRRRDLDLLPAAASTARVRKDVRCEKGCVSARENVKCVRESEDEPRKLPNPLLFFPSFIVPAPPLSLSPLFLCPATLAAADPPPAPTPVGPPEGVDGGICETSPAERLDEK